MLLAERKSEGDISSRSKYLKVQGGNGRATKLQRREDQSEIIEEKTNQQELRGLCGFSRVFVKKF